MRGRRTPSLAIAVGAALLVPLLAPTVADAAATDVVINEIMYNPPSDLGGDEFLELHNRGPEAVDLSGWSFAGITLTFAAGTSIAPNGYLVVSPDPVRFQQTYGRTAAATYTGGLSNGGETVSLRDAAAVVVDTVTYTDRAPWPGTPDGEGASLELVDPNVENNDFLDWAGSTAAAGRTPGVQNSVRRNGLGPRITSVSANPAAPAAGQAVTVTATRDRADQRGRAVPHGLRRRADRDAAARRWGRLHRPDPWSCCGAPDPLPRGGRERRCHVTGPAVRRHDRLPAAGGPQRGEQPDQDAGVVHLRHRLQRDRRQPDRRHRAHRCDRLRRPGRRQRRVQHPWGQLADRTEAELEGAAAAQLRGRPRAARARRRVRHAGRLERQVPRSAEPVVGGVPARRRGGHAGRSRCASSATPRSRGCTPTSTCSTARGATARATAAAPSCTRPRRVPSTRPARWSRCGGRRRTRRTATSRRCRGCSRGSR